MIDLLTGKKLSCLKS